MESGTLKLYELLRMKALEAFTGHYQILIKMSFSMFGRFSSSFSKMKYVFCTHDTDWMLKYDTT